MKNKSIILYLLTGYIVVLMLIGGCSVNNPEVINDGRWTERTCGLTNIDTSSSEKSCDVQLTINTLEDMTDDEMLSIVTYYWKNKFNDGEEYKEYKINVCYAVFYQGDTFVSSNKIKFSNGEKQDITQEDEYIFDNIILQDQADSKDNK